MSKMVNMNDDDSNLPLPTKVIRHIAADADVDDRTAERVLRGERVRPASQERVLAALRARGIDVSRLGAVRFGAIAAGAAAVDTDHNQNEGDPR
jgi:hypothetical protein